MSQLHQDRPRTSTGKSHPDSDQSTADQIAIIMCREDPERGVRLDRPCDDVEPLEDEHGDSRAFKVSFGIALVSRLAEMLFIRLVLEGTHALEPTAVAKTWSIWKFVRRNWSMITDGR